MSFYYSAMIGTIRVENRLYGSQGVKTGHKGRKYSVLALFSNFLLRPEKLALDPLRATKKRPRNPLFPNALPPATIMQLVDSGRSVIAAAIDNRD